MKEVVIVTNGSKASLLQDEMFEKKTLAMLNVSLQTILKTKSFGKFGITCEYGHDMRTRVTKTSKIVTISALLLTNDPEMIL